MSRKMQNDLSKRERQVMDVVYRRKSASGQEIMNDIPNPPTYSAVRSTLNILEKKGLLKHRKNGKKFIYSPTISPSKATNSAVKQLMTTYFNNSVENAVSTILKIHKGDLSEKDFQILNNIIENARKVGEV